VVISIIGLLASVVMVSVGSAKDKAKNVAAFQSMVNTDVTVQVCIMGGGILNAEGGTPTIGTAVCNPAGDKMWPSLPAPWYLVFAYLEQSTGYYMLAATDSGPGFHPYTKAIVCDYSPPTWGGFTVRGNNMNKCTKVGFD
jgi:hypothetical protein